MAKRISDEDRIIVFFTTAAQEDAEKLFRVIRAILQGRGFDVGGRKSTTGKSSKKSARPAAGRSSRRQQSVTPHRNTAAQTADATDVGGDGSEDRS